MYKTILIIVITILVNSCDLINPPAEDPNVIGGDTNLEYTKEGYVATTTVKIDNQYLPSGNMTVKKNDNGIVTFVLKFNLKGYKDSAFIAQILTPKNMENGNATMELKLKMTSEGIQDFYGERSKPWTIVKYNDGVGTEYPLTTDNGNKLVRKITEKTGQDDWPWGMMYIKTTKVEQELPESDKTAKKITFRANHKFGLVYVEMLLKTGQTVKMNIF